MMRRLVAGLSLAVATVALAGRGSVVETPLQLDAAGRKLHCFLARPDGSGPAPAVILAPSTGEITQRTRRFAKELARAGFVALAVGFDPDHLAGASSLMQEVAGGQFVDRLTAAANWIGKQSFVDSSRIGAAGRPDNAQWIEQLLQRGQVRAAIICGDEKAADSGPVHFRTCVAGVVRDNLSRQWSRASRVSEASATKQPEFARIVDIMRAINSANGVRGQLARSLEAPPSTDEQWENARSRAAILAEAGTMLLERRPPKGNLNGWRDRASQFRDSARSLLQATERHDFPAVQQAEKQLSQACAACHIEYR